ncbi:MAG: hypothetical protein OXQ29_19690 [Rhodospirillaceae bacterium]|nr:hypothetical protein [Rhodospirillaceae bacterium]
MVEPAPPHRVSITGEILDEPVEPSDAVGKWMRPVLLAAAYGGTALLLYFNVPAVRALVDNQLLMLVLPAVLWGARWWFLNRVWPDDLPRDTDRRSRRPWASRLGVRL